MCLYNYRKIIFKRKITCYKVLRVLHIFDELEEKSKITDAFFSPYFNTPYYIGEFKHSTSNTPVIDGDRITGGCFHTFKKLKDAIDFCQIRYDFINGDLCEYVVVKCTIPKSSGFVYKGETIDNHASYASQELYVDSIVYTNT